MPFCKTSGDYFFQQFTLVENLFIHEYMPFADDAAVKVYLYGLCLCADAASSDNQLPAFSQALGMPEDKIIGHFRFWEEMGLVSIVSKNPFEIRYLPVQQNNRSAKKYKPEKYQDFNKQVQSLFPTRQITPNEYLQYYELMESARMQPEALLMIIGYCVNAKGVDIRYPYILTVAKDWAAKGALSVEDVEEKLKEHAAVTENMRLIFHALGKKSAPEFEDKQMFLKWERGWGFQLDAVLFAAKLCKKRGGMQKLDKLLDEFYRLGIFTAGDMKTHAEYRDGLYTLAIEINRILGLYYETLDYIIETYTAPWLQKGFEKDALLSIAKFCVKRSIRTLEGMNHAVNKFYKLGYLSNESINTYLLQLLATDERIRALIEKTGAGRNVTGADRDFYRTWTEDWNMPDELIEYAAECSKNKNHNFSHLNFLLAHWHERGVTKLDEAKRLTPQQGAKTDNRQLAFKAAEEYNREDLDAFFSDIEEIKNIEI